MLFFKTARFFSAGATKRVKGENDFPEQLGKRATVPTSQLSTETVSDQRLKKEDMTRQRDEPDLLFLSVKRE